MTCTCGHIHLGMDTTALRSWSPECPEHGTGTDYWNSPEQVARRESSRERQRNLWRQVREARERATDG